MEIIRLPTDSITPSKKNAKKHDEAQIEKLVASIQEFGFVNPIIVHGKKHEVVCGNGRLEAAKRVGMTSIPCVDVSHLDDEAKRAFALAENQTNLMTGFNMKLLNEELDTITKAFDMISFGFENIGKVPENTLTSDEDLVECPKCGFKYKEDK